MSASSCISAEDTHKSRGAVAIFVLAAQVRLRDKPGGGGKTSAGGSESYPWGLAIEFGGDLLWH